MTGLKGNIFVKIAAFILLVIFAFATLFNAMGCVVSFENGYFTSTKQQISEKIYEDISSEVSRAIHNSIYFDPQGKVHVTYGHDYDITDIADFVISDAVTNEVLHTGLTSNNTDYLNTFVSYYNLYYDSGEHYFHMAQTHSIAIKIMLKPFKDNTVLKIRSDLLMYFYNNRFNTIIGFVLCFIMSVLLFVFLIAASGHKKGFDGIKCGFTEKIPFDILSVISALIIIFAAFLSIGLAESHFNYLSIYTQMEPFVLALGAIILLLIIAGSAFVVWAVSFAKRIKCKRLLKSCLTYKIFTIIFSKIKVLLKRILYVVKNIPFIKKTVLFVAAITLLEFLVLLTVEEEYYVLFWIIEKAVLIPLVIFIAILLNRLKQGGQQLAVGNTNNKISTEYMFWDFKEHAENLNSVGDGIEIAVEEKLKSERLKTELITNVSHDIKTPLTSIINYVDLLKKENPQGQKAGEYLEVLDRQSVRLKKLIEDLVEASKASSGNINVRLAKCDCSIILTQVLGEYSEKLSQKQLELIVKKTEQDLNIMADGRLLWRAFDNLLNNVYKYALKGSRVYLTLEKSDGAAIISIKNISQYELDITGDEIIERFVRGDRSRNTEGNGLGLSIAKSLTELQGGDFSVVTDGDLFKVVIKFNTL